MYTRMEKSQDPAQDLHDLAYDISISLENNDHDDCEAIGGHQNILHVSGTPFKSKREGYLGDSFISRSCSFQLSRMGRRVECAWNTVLGQGGYSRVYYGQVIPFPPAGVDVSAHMMLMWKALQPLLAQASTILAFNPFHSMSVASRGCASLVWQMMVKTAEIWGLVQPCAVKVLQEKNATKNKGAYGCRSIEHEVLVTLHISSACADCPYIGKAHGFDTAAHATCVLHSTACSGSPCACPNPACTDEAAVLLVLEAYTVNLAAAITLHKKHTDSAEFPCPRCTANLRRWQCDRMLSCMTGEASRKSLGLASSAASTPLQALAAPIHAARATANLFASAVTMVSGTQHTASQPGRGSSGDCNGDVHMAQQHGPAAHQQPPGVAERQRGHVSTAGQCGAGAGQEQGAQGGVQLPTQLDAPEGQVVSLWEYTHRVREAGLMLSVREILRIAGELAEAVHALHNIAHVMHLDIKPQNVLLDSLLHVKLLDFGLSAAFKPERPFIILRQRGRGTRPYTAPEMLPGSCGTVSPAADIYSFGCCVLAVCAHGCGDGAPGGETPDSFGLLKMGVSRHTDLSPFAPKELHSLIKACMSEHAFERPSAEQVRERLQTITANHTSHSTASAAVPPAEISNAKRACSARGDPAGVSTGAPPASAGMASDPMSGSSRGASGSCSGRGETGAHTRRDSNFLHPFALTLGDLSNSSAMSEHSLRSLQAAEERSGVCELSSHGGGAWMGKRPLAAPVPTPPISQGAGVAVAGPSRKLHPSRSFSVACSGENARSVTAWASQQVGHRFKTAHHQVLASPRLVAAGAALDSATTTGSKSGFSGVWTAGGVGGCGSESYVKGSAEGGCRPMPHTTSVRFGLASVMRPVSAQSSSVSGAGWYSEGSTSMSCASFPAFSMA